MQKPDSMKKFDLLFWGSMALSVIGLVLGWASMQDAMAAEMAEVDGALGEGAMQGIVIIGFIVGIGLYVGLWFLISILRIEFVKWILIALVLYGLVTMPAGFEMAGGLGIEHIPGILSTVLLLLAIWMLFRADSRAWFAAKQDAQ